MPNDEHIEKCLATNIPVSHTVCQEQKLTADFKDKQLPIIQQHLDILNNWLLKQRAPLIDLTLEECMSLLLDVTQLAANLSIVRARIRGNDLVREAGITRRHMEIKEYNTREAEIAKEQDKKEKEERRQILAAEKTNPQLKNTRKAIEGLMTSFGWSKEQAEKFLNKENIQ